MTRTNGMNEIVVQRWQYMLAVRAVLFMLFLVVAMLMFGLHWMLRLANTQNTIIRNQERVLRVLPDERMP